MSACTLSPFGDLPLEGGSAGLMDVRFDLPPHAPISRIVPGRDGLFSSTPGGSFTHKRNAVMKAV
jgi:hypothetical protein